GPVPDLSIITSSLIEFFFGEFPEFLLEFLVASVFRPDPGVTGLHTIERKHTTTRILITDLQPDADRFLFAFPDDAIPEFGMVRSGQFIDVDQHHIVADDVMTHETHVIDHYIIPEIATDDRTVIQPYRHAQVIEFMVVGFQFPDADQSVEFTIPDQFRIE